MRATAQFIDDVFAGVARSYRRRSGEGHPVPATRARQRSARAGTTPGGTTLYTYAW